MTASQAALHLALFAIRLVTTVVLLCITLSLFSLKLQNTNSNGSQSPITSVVVAVKTSRRSLIVALLSLVALTYFLDGFALIVHSVITKTWQGTPDNEDWWNTQWSGLEVESLGGLLASGLLAIVGQWKESQGVDVWLKKRVRFWTFVALASAIAEICLLPFTVDFLRKQPVSIPELPPLAQPSFPNLLHSLFPLIRLLILIPLYPSLAYPRIRYVPAADLQNPETFAAREETTLLLPPEEGAIPSQGLAPSSIQDRGRYGTFTSRRSNGGSGTHTPALSEGAEPSQVPLKPGQSSKSDDTIPRADTPSWGEMWCRLKRITPYLWPKKSAPLQFLAFLCMLLLVIGRFVNVALPLTLGELLHIFEAQFSGAPSPKPRSPWPYLLAYVGLRFLQSSGGLGALRDTLWAPVMQYSDREMSEMTFAHLLALSLAFHTRRKTGEVLRILDRGAAINRVFQLLLFNIMPTFLDITIALGVFVWRFGWELAILIFFVMVAYVAASIVMTTWRTKIRREMNDRDVITRGIHTDCLLNYETVKYFGGEAYEGERYSDAIRQYQMLEYRVVVSLNLLNLVQSLIITIGLLVGSYIVALRVTRGESDPSEFVVFITYLAQLYGPLNQIGFIYRQINTSLVDTERLMKLLDEPTEVNDKPGAPDLVVKDGEIIFDNVSFSYDDRTTALSGVSFKVPTGSSVALVGESGSGKSTVLRLLYRFYDLKEGQGRILIDGKDIRDVTQLSLRKAIGVVPQDSVLFNNSIGYNIGYGKFGASTEEIEAAAKAAQMHDRILSFPQGYETKVGERGVRLSGGEKQRVAIARTVLKNPPILLLDEATSALDTSTEKDIQKALQNLVKGRSSLSIAHRLSTIASADLILVLKDGKIVEQGTHKELLAHNGVFAAMWANQVSAEDTVLSVVEGLAKKEGVVEGYDVDAIKPSITSQDVSPAAMNEQSKLVDTDGAPDIMKNEAGMPEAITQAPEILSDEPALMNESEANNHDASIIPTSYAAAAAAPPGDNAAVTHHIPSVQPFPSSTAPTVAPDAPVAFPISGDDTTSQHTASVAEGSVTVSADQSTRATSPSGPSVTFGAGVNTPPRSSTPDIGGGESGSEPGKRKRTASQNFQRFARRISIGQIMPKRSGSTTSIPVASAQSPGKSESGRPSIGATERARSESRMSFRRTDSGSPASSIAGVGEGDGKKGKKEDKDKIRKGSSTGK